MSIFNSLTTAVSGMDAQSTAFTNLGNNIANSQTVGYKADTTAFQDFVAGSTAAGDFTNANADSVAGLTAQHVDRQGQTVSSLDSLAMAINGNGMFNVAKSAGQATTGTPEFQGGYYTRNGEFYEDKNGYLVNPAGYYLEGYMTDANGNLDTTKLTQINVKQNTQFHPTRTTIIKQNAILPSDYVPGNSSSYNSKSKNGVGNPKSYETQPVTTFDADGHSHKIALSWQQSQYNPLSWTVKAYSADGTQKMTDLTYNVNFDNEGHIQSVYSLGQDITKSITTPDSGPNKGKTLYTDSSGAQQQLSKAQTFKANDGHTYLTSAVGNELPDEPVNLEINATTISSNETQNINIDLGALGASNGTTLQVSSKSQSSPGSNLPTLTTSSGSDGKTDIAVTPKNGSHFFSLGSATDAQQSFMTAPSAVFDSNGQKHNVAMQFTEQSSAEQRWTAHLVDLSDGDKVISNDVTYKPDPDTWDSGNPTAAAQSSGFVNLQTKDTFTPKGDAAGFLGNISTPGKGTDPAVSVHLAVNNESTPSVLTTDSVSSGNFEQAEISNDGSIVGVYDNGDTQLIGKVALTKFPDENGLTAVDGQAYQASTQSGEPETSMVGQNGTGSLSVGYVESSTTNLTADLSNLIVTQEAYSANTKTVTTADELLQTTIAMKQS